MTEKPEKEKGKDENKINIGSRLAAEKCENAARIIRERGKTHGDAFENLDDVARRWTSRLRAMGYRGRDLSVVDVCYFMDEVKLSRSAFGNHMEADHLDDTIGYSAIGSAYIAHQKSREPLRLAKDEEAQPENAVKSGSAATTAYPGNSE